MKQIQLTQGKVALVDDGDYERVNQYHWHTQQSDIRFYALRNLYKDGRRTTETMHHFLFGVDGLKVDHIDSDGLNNQKSNIRLSSSEQNVFSARMRRQNSIGFKGVHHPRNIEKFCAAIRHRGKQIHIGTFDNAVDAARAYNAKAKELFGEFAKLNPV